MLQSPAEKLNVNTMFSAQARTLRELAREAIGEFQNMGQYKRSFPLPHFARAPPSGLSGV